MIKRWKTKADSSHNACVIIPSRTFVHSLFRSFTSTASRSRGNIESVESAKEGVKSCDWGSMKKGPISIEEQILSIAAAD